MKQRGRASAAALALASPTTLIERPAAPLELTPEEADEWHAIVNALPADWFPRETWPLLKQLVRHTIAARRIAQMLDAEMARPDLDVAAIDKLLAMQARETTALKAMAAATRTSQQASYHPERAGTAKGKRATMSRPWEGD